MRALLLLASLMVAAPAGSAAPPPPGSGVLLDKCLAQSPGATPGIVHVTGCYRAALTRVDAALAGARQMQQARLKARAVPPTTLVAGETAWRAYRDRWCAFEATAERDPGSREATGLECQVEVSQTHLARLKGAN
jgi:uncharacterized protein YecT (DUF1311 family)